MEQREDKIKHEVEVIRIGNSLYRRIPPKQQDHLDITEGTTLETQTEYSEEHGPYLTEWNPEQQESGTDE